MKGSQSLDLYDLTRSISKGTIVIRYNELDRPDMALYLCADLTKLLGVII